MSGIDPTKPTAGNATTESVRDNFAAAASEIDGLEAAAIVQDGRLDTNEADILQNQTDIGTLNTEQGVQDGRIGQNETDIDTLNTEQGVQDGRIGQNETDIGTNATNIATNATNIGNNTTAIAGKVDRSGDAMTGQLDGITPVDPANLTRKDWVEAAIAAGGGGGGAIPGSIALWPVAAAPVGYVICNGQVLDTTAESDLFGVIGYTYGGAGASFNVPDYRGTFLRGADNGAGVDPDAATRTDRGDGTTGDNVGTKQDDENASHAHAAAGDHGHAADGNHQHTSAGDHGHSAVANHQHASVANHQHASAGDHNHLLQTFQSGANDPQVTYAQIDDDDTETPTNLTTPTTTNGAHQHAAAGGHQHAAAGGHSHPNAGAHTHPATGSHTHANAGSHSHAAAGGNESRPVNASINFIIKL